MTSARRARGEAALAASNRVYTLLAVGGIAFASIFLMVAWQYGPLVLVEAQQYRKFTQRVDARIVDAWLALELDASTVVYPPNWRSSTNTARCVVAEYGGDWGSPLRRAFCGTRVPFNDSYMLADLRDISPGVPFVWTRDERGFPAQATLANGERLVWRFTESVYADTIGRFHFAAPNPPIASEKAALAALTATITSQARTLDDTARSELFANLERDKRVGLTGVGFVFRPAAEEAAADPAAGAATAVQPDASSNSW